MTHRRQATKTLTVLLCAWCGFARAAGPATVPVGGVDLLQGLRTVTFEDSSKTVRCLAISPNGRWLAAGGWKKAGSGSEVGVWDISSGKLVASLTQAAAVSNKPANGLRVTNGFPYAVDNAIAFSPDSSKLAASDGVRLALYDVASGKSQWAIQQGLPYLGYGSMAFSPQGKILATGGTGTGVQEGVTVDGRKILATGGSDLKLIDVATGKELAVLDHRMGECMAFSSDGNLLAVGYYDNRVRFWDVATRRQVAEVHAQMGIIRGIALSPDGKKVAVGCEGPIKLWRINRQGEGIAMETPVLITEFQNSGFQFSPDSKLLAVGGRAVRLWSTETPKVLATLPIVACVAFSPDGKFLAIGRAGTPNSPGSIDLLKVAAILDPAAQAARAKVAAAGLVRALRDRQGPRFADAIAQIDPTFVAAVPALAEALKDPRVEVRCTMAWALSRIGPEAKAAVPALVEAMHDDVPEVIQAAAQALRVIDPDALAKALPAAKAKMQQPPAWRHGPAGDTYQGRSLPQWIEKLGESLIPNEIFGRSNHSAPEAAIRAVGPASVPALTAALSDSRWYIRQATAERLGWFPAESKSAIPALVTLLGDKTQQVRSQAADSLGLMYKAAASTHPATTRPVVTAPLRDALTNTNTFVRVAAARAILQADPADTAAMNELRRCVAENPETRRKAAQAKGGEEWQRWLADNRFQMEYGTSYTMEALCALSKLGPAALPAMPELIAATRANRNLNRDLVELAVEAIGSIGPQATPAVPALMDLLGSRDADAHNRVVDALAHIGPPAVPALIKVLSDPFSERRKAATWALGKIGPGAAAAIPELERLKSDPNSLVVVGAQQALYRIEKK